MMQGKVSMVVPCYNKEKYIGNMLRSVCEQVWDNIELILVNDGSIDGTRGVILEWLPMLEKRGYSVVLIDQENGGCCSAVLSGLKRMTGDYFCLVDCDDEIFPEYVSRMAGWLDENADYEWAACSYQPFLALDGRETAQPPVKPRDSQDGEGLLERHILRRLITTVWIYMARVSYIKKCKLVENFCGERRATYEPPIIVPLATGGGRMKYFDEPLYKYNRYASDLYYFDSYAKVEKYYGDYLYLYEWSINRLDASDEQKRRLVNIARLANKRDVLYHLNAGDVVEQKVEDRDEHLEKVAKSTSDLINNLFDPPPNIAPSCFMDGGFYAIFSCLDEIILGIAPRTKRGLDAQIVGYGVLGKRAAAVIPRLAGSAALPGVMWDEAANPGDELCGVPVTKPDFSSLSESDVVLVFPASEEVLGYVKRHCKSAEVVHVPREYDKVLRIKTLGLTDYAFMPGLGECS